MSRPISNRQAFVVVEYDVAVGKTTERRRTVPMRATQAKRIYIAKLNAGKNPRIIAEPRRKS